MKLRPDKYNKKNEVYIYHPSHLHSDDNGILTYNLIGVTKKKSDKRILIMCEIPTPDYLGRNQVNYFEIKDNLALDCGGVFLNTKEA